MNELTDEQIDAITVDMWGANNPGVLVNAQREFARAVIAADRDLQSASEPAQQAPKTDVHALFWAMRSKILKLPRYSFLLNNGGGVSKVADRYGRWIEKDSAAELCEVEHVDALLEAADEIETHERKPMTDVQIDAAIEAWFASDIVAGPRPFAKRMQAALDAATKETP